MSRFIGRFSAALTISALLLGALALPASADTNIETLLVDDNGVQCPTATFTSIQDAIDYAGPGDTIIVCPGTYTEQLVVNKSVTVKAKPLFQAHINAPGLLAPTGGVVAAVVVNGNGAVFKGFRMHIAAGPTFTVRPSLLSCAHVDVAILVLGNDVRVSNNKINATGSATLSGACGYDYGIVVGQHATTGVRPTGTSAVSATARVTFNHMYDFKRGGILVEETDSYAYVRRNDVRYIHAGEAISPCIDVCTSVRSYGGVNELFVYAFGIGVEGGAQADIIRNAIRSGPNALPFPVGPPGVIVAGPGVFTPRLGDGIVLTNLSDAESNVIHHNAIWRVGTGIRTESSADGAVISYNHITGSQFGLGVYGAYDEFHHNHGEDNGFGAYVFQGLNNFHDNRFEDSIVYDCYDATDGGSGDAGTDNTWTNNIGATAQPDAICDPAGT